MDESLMKDWERLKLTDEENVIFGQSDVSLTEEMSNTKISLSLVGKLLTKKSFNVEAMKRVLKTLWRIDDNVAIRGVNTNIFVFQFFNIDDRKKVLEGRPWVFDNQILLLKEMCATEQPSEVSFDACPFWIRLLDVPFGMRSSRVAHEIGNCIGECIDVDESDPLCWDEFMRVKVMVNINKPLRRGMKIAVEDGCAKWIGFKYERLGDFCYYCGRIGHTDKDCEQKDGGSDVSLIVFQYGPFLTASPYRSKVSEIDREHGRRWLERLNSRGRLQRSDYNDPKAIKLGPPSAARKLLFSSPVTPKVSPPLPRSIALRTVDCNGDGKLSDHALIVLTTENHTAGFGGHTGFKFEALWLSNEECGEVVGQGWRDSVGCSMASRVAICSEKLASWAALTFGLVKKRIKKGEKRLSELKRGAMDAAKLEMCNSLSNELDELYKLEESYWHARARDDNGDWFENQVDIERLIEAYFARIFATSAPMGIPEALEGIEEVVSEEMNDINSSVCVPTPLENSDMGLRVSDLIDHETMSWRQEVLADNFNMAEQTQIQSIPLSFRCVKDRMFWWPARCGKYSVKSGYWLAKHGPATIQRQPQDEIWRIIWSMKIPPKLAHFLWRACKGFLVVRERLALIEQAPDSSFCERFLWLASKTTSNELRSIATLTWAAWWCRNKVVFEHEDLCPISIASNLAKSVQEYADYAKK
uniref:CCHC-type domain-containing protein n=1 Tax=Chenopodium quinoa TaxID=63459 RepID=A0A803MW53_CHEQI